MRTQVGIVGAGPAGLALALLLERAGIESVVLECRTREHVETRVRAGLLEQNTVDLLTELGVAGRLHREGLVHEGIHIRRPGATHRIDIAGLTGRRITIYGQQEVVRDLIAARLARGGAIHFEARATAIDGIGGERPTISFLAGGETEELSCDFVAGCDGFHGISRLAVPEGALVEYEQVYPFGVAGDPRGSSPGHRRADLRLARAWFRALLDALGERQPALPAGARGRAHRVVAGRADLG